jgi:mitochondrial enoyl-[acyl-carrier protein] reductase / trans-2-enoyl-CoA reductase
MAVPRSFARPIGRVLTSTTRLHRPLTQQRRHLSAYGYEQAKALTFADYGEPASVLSLHGHSISPAHSDLLTLRFLASPINPADINQIQGTYPSKPTFTTSLGTTNPIAVGGNEGVAEVIAAGSGVKGFQKGDWVIMKQPGFGTWRTHAQTTAENLVPIRNREGISAVQAGTLSINPCTAYRMLRDFAPLKEGEWFLQNGANSGVGRAAIQLGKRWGYRSINIIRKREGFEEMKKELEELGADVVISDEQALSREFSSIVKESTNGGREPVKLALNCVGGKIVNSMAKVLAPDAHVVTYGAMAKEPTQLPAGLLIFKNLNFTGFWVSKWAKEHPEEKVRTMDDILGLIRSGQFKDTPFQELEWNWDTKQEDLVQAVAGTLGGFRPGKGIFVFKDT